ncbi:hypothetical protein KSP39_PZI011271 [Platanthera zijinensis]|uniref:Uncharacterized protein n=1 Tax=Platanthera zijinensis TaxID=2320716 RepID=A0AAP0BH51_9ASPA
MRRREALKLLDDLKLKIINSSVLCPSEPAEKRTMFLSNIDQVLNFSVEAVQFFASKESGFGFETEAQIVRSAMERLLVMCDFLAGRLRMVERLAI